MPQKRADESLSSFAIRCAYEFGHFWNPDNQNGLNITQADLPKLKPTDKVVVDALISLSKMDATTFTRASLDHTGKLPEFDGRLTAPMWDVLDGPNGRCPVPDFAPPLGVVFAFEDPYLQQVVTDMQARQNMAVGSGNWKRCHNVGDAHCATVMIDDRNLPVFLQPLWKQVLTNVQLSYANVGLLFRFMDQNKVDVLTGEDLGLHVNINMSFVSSSDGWIGLAIVGTGETCGGTIWCRFLNTYKGGQNDQQIITQWTTLLKHELGHNTGRSHTNGGVMNPSIVNGLPLLWTPEDPSYNWLVGQFSGVAVQIPGQPKPPDDPKPPTNPGDTNLTLLQKQLRDVQLKNVIQDVHLKWLTDQVSILKGGRT